MAYEVLSACALLSHDLAAYLSIKIISPGQISFPDSTANADREIA